MALKFKIGNAKKTVAANSLVRALPSPLSKALTDTTGFVQDPLAAVRSLGGSIAGANPFASHSGPKSTIGDETSTPAWQDFVSGINQNNTLKGQVSVQGITGAPISQLGSLLDESGLNAIRSRAGVDSEGHFLTADSPWLALAKQKQALEQTNLSNSVAANAAGQEATARSNLARMGGLRGGAAERLATNSANDQALARQGVLNQGALMRSQLGLSDQEMKDKFLSQLPQVQLANAQYKTGIDSQNLANSMHQNEFDIQNRLANNAALNQANQTKYTEGMKAKGAAMTAQAIANGGKK